MVGLASPLETGCEFPLLPLASWRDTAQGVGGGQHVTTDQRGTMKAQSGYWTMHAVRVTAACLCCRLIQT